MKYHALRADVGVVAAGTLYPALGEGSRARLDIGPDGSLVAASRTARRVTGCRNDPECTPKDTLLDLHKARDQAWQQARELGVSFQEPRLTWGYLEAPATCYQREMGIVYRFTFEPEPEETAAILVVDVAAQVVEPPACFGPGAASAPGLPPGCELASD